MINLFCNLNILTDLFHLALLMLLILGEFLKCFFIKLVLGMHFKSIANGIWCVSNARIILSDVLYSLLLNK